MTSALTQGLERIPDQLGYLVLSEGAVLASSGDLENDEQAASAISELVSTACGFRLHHGMNVPFKRLSGEPLPLPLVVVLGGGAASRGFSSSSQPPTISSWGLWSGHFTPFGTPLYQNCE
ncbi:PREDICTED: ragulator complex protein LAMTOR4 isoform X1 [Colobus angolensis palliatus]|uniref:ragulator complex protein LAMTOR4 isoform X1 n=1 Tax=Colobus angolensis palliatus TaxID=336983 RepID=UPI0005F49227|nr:PREDICTED: ragulator complex protein LAMTOR4 isoform X1 [Colobus angolensis palliatus]